MKTVILTRTCLPTYTLGEILMPDGVTTFQTLELPFRDNKRNISCIPEGRYMCRKICSQKFGETFEVCGVPNRSEILFHQGNYTTSTRGCILVGERWAPAQEMLQDTKLAMSKFMSILKNDDTFELIIKRRDDDENSCKKR